MQSMTFRVTLIEVDSETVSESRGRNRLLLEEGTVVCGYRIGKVIGRGGMATVYDAWDVRRDCPVALKIMRRGGRPASKARFEREARHAATIRHKNVVRIFDLGSLPDGRSYLTMERLFGLPLSRWLGTGHVFTVRQLNEIITPLFRAVGAVHTAGLVHRDIKPGNLFITSEGAFKLIDFGLSIGGHGPRLTREGQVVGTPVYVSPEQVLGEPIDFRTDVYAIGMTMWTLATGRSPFDENRPFADIFVDAVQNVPPLASEHADVPCVLADVLAKMYRKKPSDRYATIADAAQAWRTAYASLDLD